MNSRRMSSSLSWQAYKARPLPIPAFRFFNDLRLSEPFPSAVLLMGFLRIANSDARSSFSRQQLGRFWPVAKWLLASVAIWLLTVGKPSATETSSKNVDNGRSCAHYVGHNLVGYIKRVADSLGEFEQLVLTGVLLLGEHAYGLAMHAKISELAAPRNVRLGAVYMTLDRLKDKGLLRSWMSDPTPERGGRSKRYYELTARGARALKQSTPTAKRISDAVEKLRRLGKWKLDRI